jgi:hypothetical protein
MIFTGQLVPDRAEHATEIAFVQGARARPAGSPVKHWRITLKMVIDLR